MDELYVLARRVLLDALEALGEQRKGIVLVGAQAIYLRVGEGNLAVAPFTSDADLGLDPEELSESPPLQAALWGAGFRPKGGDSVGTWVTSRKTRQGESVEVLIDLLVPESMAYGTSRRSANLPGHDPKVARRVQGLEAAIVDTDELTVKSFDDSDPRIFQVLVAGPAGLLAAKLQKIADRAATPRLSDKDALDVLRLLQGVSTAELTDHYRRILADPRSRDAAEKALRLLREQFAVRDGLGIAMAVRAIGNLGDPAEIAASCQALASELLESLGR